MRRLLLPLGLLVVVAVIGVVLNRGGSDAQTVAPNVAEAVAVENLPRVEQDSLLAARTAAIAAVSMTGQIAVAGFISRREIIGSFATPAFTGDLAARTTDHSSGQRMWRERSSLAGRDCPRC